MTIVGAIVLIIVLAVVWAMLNLPWWLLAVAVVLIVAAALSPGFYGRRRNRL